MFELPSGHRQRSRARNILSAEQIAATQWRVSGGENLHLVSIYPSQTGYDYTCDCGFTEKICSHKLAVMLQLEPDKMDWHRRNAKFSELAQQKRQVRELKRKQRLQKKQAAR